jgi:hypothetical protein
MWNAVLRVGLLTMLILALALLIGMLVEVKTLKSRLRVALAK